MCLPKAELKTKTNPNGHHPVAVWVRFGFQLGSHEKKCSGLRGEPCRLESVKSICPISHLLLMQLKYASNFIEERQGDALMIQGKRLRCPAEVWLRCKSIVLDVVGTHICVEIYKGLSINYKLVSYFLMTQTPTLVV